MTQNKINIIIDVLGTIICGVSCIDAVIAHNISAICGWSVATLLFIGNFCLEMIVKLQKTEIDVQKTNIEIYKNKIKELSNEKLSNEELSK